MACSSCAKKRQNSYQNFSSIENPPFRASDIVVYNTDTKTYRKFIKEDWLDTNHVLFFVPEVDSIKFIGDIAPLAEFNCQLLLATNQSVHRVNDYYAATPTALPISTLFISYLLPSRLNILLGGLSKKAIVYIMKDGDVAVQELFVNNSFDFDAIYKQLKEYFS